MILTNRYEKISSQLIKKDIRANLEHLDKIDYLDILHKRVVRCYEDNFKVDYKALLEITEDDIIYNDIVSKIICNNSKY